MNILALLTTKAGVAIVQNLNFVAFHFKAVEPIFLQIVDHSKVCFTGLKK
jgi:hypothetical protein